ncbi:hypothetical protein FWK35_00026780 [Aphis craccivora]|uniref:Uncharacterized protein n=1 Tax=Aphis craccivora TaxID=307492 RepID=A0A6G0Y919_APHCR|nr:hypothetical protein FWK35_00026780 [Aphis craccivora]
MMCVFFVSVYSITIFIDEIMLQFQTLGVVSDVKVNILGAFTEVKSKHFPTVFKKIEKNKKKND